MWPFAIYPLVEFRRYKTLNGVEDGENGGEADPER